MRLQNDFSEVECSLIGRYLVTLPLSGFEGEKEILIFSVDEAGNEVEINLEIVYDTISPEVSIDLISGKCSERPIPTIFDGNKLLNVT